MYVPTKNGSRLKQYLRTRSSRYKASDYEVDCDVMSHILSRVDCNFTSYIF